MTFDIELIKKFLRDEMGLNEKDASSDNLFGDGLLDSLNMIRLVSWIEKNALIKFGPLDISLENLNSAERISSFVEAKRRKSAG